MSENIKIPKILQERNGPSLHEKAKNRIHDTYESAIETRKKISKEMARVILDITFDKRSVKIDNYDEDNPEKYDQDVAFASYEPNLRETYHREKIERAKEVGSLAMVLTGLDLVGGMRADKRGSRAMERNRRAGNIARNGTLKSRLRDRYVTQVKKATTPKAN